MFSKVKKILSPLMRWTPAGRLAALEEELSKGWSYRAYDALRRMAEEGDAAAQYRLGQVFERAEGVIQNLADAVHWYRLAAEQGHTPAQARLGLIYFVDPPAPASLTADGFERLSKGEVRAGSMLEKLFPHGFAVTKDLAEAAKWNRMAAEGGAADAQARYGHQLALGLGVNRDEVQAEQWLGAAARQGDSGGQVGLGVLYAGGYGTLPDYPRALEWLQKASETGNPAAQCWLAILLLQGEGVTRDVKSAIEHLQRAVAQDHVEAMYLLGITLARGEDLAADASTAETLLRRAASRGHLEAACALANLLLDQAGEEGAEAVSWLRHAADAGHKGAAAALGEMHLAGRGVPRNPAEAGRWLEIGETESRPEAFTVLASLYAEGIGVEQNFNIAADWLQRAVSRGSVVAHYNLGWLYRLGQGVPEDREEAARWYRQAADLGNAEAAFCLGLINAEDNLDARADYAEAAAWFTRASEAGHIAARYNLAFLLIQGQGIEPDPPRALDLLDEAAAAGSAAAAEALFNLYSNGKHFPPSPELAAKSLARAVELGSASAAIVLADWHLEGRAVPFDAEVAMARLEVAANEGDVETQVALGRLLYAGLAGLPDVAGSHAWFARAAEAGHAFAQAWMGDCCRMGLVDAPDAEAAETWYRRAAAQNHAGAVIVLANAMQAAGPSTPDTLAEIFGLWLLAASAGHAVAQRNVAQCYLEGRGCTADPTAATRWFRAAAEQGDAEAEYQLASYYRNGLDVQTNPQAALVCISCDPERLYAGGGFYDPEVDLNQLFAIAAGREGPIETVAEIFPRESVSRMPPHFIGGLDSAEHSELEESFVAVNREYKAIAPSFLVKIHDAALWNNMLFVLCDGKYLPLYECYRFIERHLKPPDIFDRLSKVERRTTRRARTDGSALFVGSAGSFNYGHWLIDDFPAFAAVQLPHYQWISTVVMSKGDTKINNVRREGLGTLTSDGPARPVLKFVDPDIVYSFEELYYVSPVSYHPTLKSRAATEYTKAACEHKFATVAADARALPRPQSGKTRGGAQAPCERIFVNRSDSATRQLTNISEIRAILTKFGFKEIWPEKLTFQEQWHAFRYAKCVVGIMGAAMTNTLFSSPQTRLIYLAPAGWAEPFFWDLANANRQTYEVIFGPGLEADRPAHERSFSIDTALLTERILEVLHAEESDS